VRRALVLAIVIAGCGGDIDPAWQLDHDRIIAVRATPNRIASGEVADIDALLGRAGEPPLEVVPATATVISPMVLRGALAMQGPRWTVTAPDAVQLAAARTELGLAADAPVPLRLRVTFAELPKTGLKIVWLGEHADNPVLDPILVDGMDAKAMAALSVGAEVDVPLKVNFDDSYVVNWLTSCGTMHDFDLPNAYLRVEPEDPKSGSLAVVVRDELGGVAWHVWPITAQ
jgi:hypothetical protein